LTIDEISEQLKEIATEEIVAGKDKMINKMTFCLEDKIKDSEDQVSDCSKKKLIKLFLECLKSAYDHPVKQFWEVILGRRIYEQKLTEKLFCCTTEPER
jgi:hypothetical protein